jgi:DNA-binding beta-propeller fold protein YncE
MPTLRPLVLAAALGAGCGKSADMSSATTPPPTPTIKGDGTIRELTPAAMAGAMFSGPLDATLSPDGKIAYFIARGPDGAPAVFQSAAGVIKQLAAGPPLAAPFGIDITADGKTLIIADPGALSVDEDVDVRGQLLSLPVVGGTAAVLSGATGFAPRGLAVAGDQIYFTGATVAEHTPGVFRVPVAGGAVMPVAMGDPFTDPSGVAVSESGDAYVVDTAGQGSDHARLIAVHNGSAAVLLEAIKVGFPAGVALSQDDKTVLISALDPARSTDLVIRYATGSKETQEIASGIDSFTESAGLHRARNADTYVWADSTANGGGTVYVINPLK